MVTIATFLDALEIHVCTFFSEVADYCRKTIPKENRKFAHFNLQEIPAVGTARGISTRGIGELDVEIQLVFWISTCCTCFFDVNLLFFGGPEL